MTSDRRIISKMNMWILHLSIENCNLNQLNTDIQVMSSRFINANSWQKLLPSKWYMKIKTFKITQVQHRTRPLFGAGKFDILSFINQFFLQSVKDFTLSLLRGWTTDSEQKKRLKIFPFTTIALTSADSFHLNSIYHCHNSQVFQDFHFGIKCGSNLETPLRYAPT